MSQSIATLAKYYPIDLPGITQAGQTARMNDIKLQNAPLQSELERMKLNDEIGQQSALAGYREAAAEDGPIPALGTLDAYPDMQGELYKHLEKGSPEDRENARKRTELFGNAARYVKSFPPGSKEQLEAWKTSLDVLREAGAVDDDLYNMAMKTGPSDALLNQVLSVEEWTKLHVGPKADKTRAEIDLVNTRKGAVEAGITRSDRDVDDRIGNRNRRTDALNDQGEARVGIMRDKDGKKVPGSGGKSKGMTEAQRSRLAIDIEKLLDERNLEGDERKAAEAELRIKAGLDAAPSAAPAALPIKTPDDGVLQQARDAIARGADPEAIRKRLIDNGYDASGL